MPRRPLIVIVLALLWATQQGMASPPGAPPKLVQTLLEKAFSYPAIQARGRSGSGLPHGGLLAKARVYEVRGPATDEEKHVATDAGNPGQHVSSLRHVQVALFPVGSRRWVGLLQYTFPNVDHCNQCDLLGKVALLHRTGQNWSVTVLPLEEIDPVITSFRLTDVTGDGQPEALVTAQSEINARYATTLWVFDLQPHGIRLRLQEEIVYDSTLSGFEHLKRVRTLDVPRTLADQGRRFHFTQVTSVDATGKLDPPRREQHVAPGR